MKTLLATIVMAMLAGCASEPVESSVESAEKYTGGFTGMVRRTLGLLDGFTLTNYGCHCGLGSPDGVTWVDEVDNCCRIHDEKYLAAPMQTPPCNCRDVEYTYEIDAMNKVTCDPKLAGCAKYCCAADSAFVACVQGAPPLDPANANIDRANRCEPLQCIVDDDCDGGMYCDRGICRMYCDPGGGGFATPACEITPISAAL